MQATMVNAVFRFGDFSLDTIKRELRRGEEPMDMVFEGTGNEDDEVIGGYVEQVTDKISVLIDNGVRAQEGRA